jgi:hypothetical protein
MTGEGRYGLLRGLFIVFCVFLIAAAGLRSCVNTISHFTPHSSSPAFSSTKYQRRFCDEDKVLDFSKKKMSRIAIPLTEGCYGPRVILPESWQTFEPQKSQNPGDYISVWCNGHPNPGPLIPYYTAGTGMENGCFASTDRSANFYIQGHGTLTLIATQARFGSRLDDSERSESALVSVASPLKIDPIKPESGGDSDFNFLLDECHRSSDQIRCSGKITNLTDAPTHTYLRDSTAVDDEGNSFFVGTFGGGLTFGSGFGDNTRLMPDVPTRFEIHVNDAHRNVKTINLQINVDWTGRSRYDTLAFQGVTVQ